MRAKRTPDDRFWEKVEQTGDGPDDCWLWTGARVSTGYGNFNDGRTWLAHRWLWVKTNGPLSPREFLCHSCHNPACVRPLHLYVGNYKTNARDMVEAGRAGWQQANGVWGAQPGEANTNAKLTELDVQVMRYLYHRRGATPWMLAQLFPIERVSVYNVVHRRYWKHVLDFPVDDA